MTGLPGSIEVSWRSSVKMRLLTAVSIVLIPFSVGIADNLVYVDIARSGSAVPVDTLFSGGSYDFRIWIENDNHLSSLVATLRNKVTTSPVPGGAPLRGTFFTWENVGGYGPSGLNTGHACVTVVPSSRMDPPNVVWDYTTGFRVREHDLNEVSPDSIGISGNAAVAGLPPGPLQHMVTIHFKATSTSMNTVYMHLDSAFISVGGGMVFLEAGGMKITPLFTSASPWQLTARCGDPNGDGDINVGDVVFLIQYIFRSGAAPKPAIVANVNGDEEVNVGDVVYLINHIFTGGPAPDCN